jgi:hypothetical protein
MPTGSLAASLDQPANRKTRLASVWCREHGVSLQTFHRWRLRQDGPPAYKLFGTWFVDDDQMAAWIESRSARPAPAPSPVQQMTSARHAEVQRAIDEARELMASR